ncbi:Ankyrin-2 [Puttea exsequens]|nr:Ankyrin-2 [Puttea exsequens]
MEQLFSDRECLEEMLFTTLHRIILGLNQSPLGGYILQNADCINATDSYGRTALSWAAQRGMVDAVETLLHFSADPNLCTPRGHSPLMYAAEARDPGCLQPLLDHGADVTQWDIEGQTALHYAAGHRADLAYYRPLIEANSDPNWLTIPRMTPLTTVILEGHNEATKYQVDSGADINLNGHDERSPAFYAIEYNNHFALDFLYQRGASFTGASIACPSIAHVAAHHADIKTLRILTTFQLKLRDIDCVDHDGLAIPQIVEKKVRRSLNNEGDFAQAFSIFLESLRTEG